MGLDREAFEGGQRLAHIRRARRLLMVVQVIFVLIAMVVLGWMYGMIQLDPFFLDLAAFLNFIIFVWLLITVESFFFCYLEMKYTKSGSSKFFMLKASHKKCMITMVVWIAAVVVLVTPFLGDAVANMTSADGETADAVKFYSGDRGGFTKVDKITVRSTSGNGAAMIVSEGNYNAYKNNMEMLRTQTISGTQTDLKGGDPISFPDMGGFGAYYLVIDSDSAAEYTIHRSLDRTMVAYIVIFSILFIGVLGGWIILTLNTRNKFATSAIYR